MNYCPFCAEKLLKPVKVCPYCKKSIDPQLLKDIYTPAGGPSGLNRKLLWKRWFTEHSLFIYPIIALILGLIAGIILAYSYAALQFSSEKSAYQQHIAELQNTLQQRESSVSDIQSSLQKQIAKQNEIVKILLEQKDVLSRLIYFTRLLSENSALTPNTPEDIENYRRNTIHLIRLFNESQTKLISAGLEDTRSYNLQTIPALLQQATN